MKHILVAFALTALMMTNGAMAHEVTHKHIKAVHPWVFETEGPQAALSVKLKNSGKAADRLLRGSCGHADEVAVVDAQGKKLSGITVPAGGELVLKNGGPRIVLSGLKKPLRAYDSFDVTFVFEKAGPMKVEVMVEEAPATDQPGGG